MAFQECIELTSISLPDTVTKIGFGAFHKCKKLTFFAVFSRFVTIGPNVFKDCQEIKTIICSKNKIKLEGYKEYELTINVCKKYNIIIPKKMRDSMLEVMLYNRKQHIPEEMICLIVDKMYDPLCLYIKNQRD